MLAHLSSAPRSKRSSFCRLVRDVGAQQAPASAATDAKRPALVGKATKLVLDRAIESFGEYAKQTPWVYRTKWVTVVITAEFLGDLPQNFSNLSFGAVR